jgi:excisionase family DNA binding protein
VADAAMSRMGPASEMGSTAPQLRDLPDGLPRLLLTPEEAARALGIGRTKLYELLSTAKLPSVRIGGSRRVSVDALTEFVRRLTPTPGSVRVR